MTKAVLEAEGEGAAAQAISMVPSPVLAGSCKPACFANGAARPARPAKEVAQTGAAIGREFSHALLAAVAQIPVGLLLFDDNRRSLYGRRGRD
jgi:hypothetical protein